MLGETEVEWVGLGRNARRSREDLRAHWLENQQVVVWDVEESEEKEGEDSVRQG